MSAPSTAIFLCPQCRQPLRSTPLCSCGFVLRESNGILNLITEAELAQHQAFLEAYDRVRNDEGWGGDDLDLPFHPRRHHDIWNIRQRTFNKVQSIVENVPRGLALDVGAGSCWMTRYLDRWGFDAVAVDINDGKADGLRAGQKFIDDGARFLRVRSSMQPLPFAASTVTLLATSASFHYAFDFRATLSEFERVLSPGGTIVIADVPVYERQSDGERMVSERVRDFRAKYGIPEALAARARYLTVDDLGDAANSLRLDLGVSPVWPGLRRSYERLRGRLLGRRIAEFPLLILKKKR